MKDSDVNNQKKVKARPKYFRTGKFYFSLIRLKVLFISMFSSDIYLYVLIFLLILVSFDYLFSFLSTAFLAYKERRLVFFFNVDPRIAKSELEKKIVLLSLKMETTIDYFIHIFLLFLLFMMIPRLFGMHHFWIDMLKKGIEIIR